MAISWQILRMKLSATRGRSWVGKLVGAMVIGGKSRCHLGTKARKRHFRRGSRLHLPKCAKMPNVKILAWVSLRSIDILEGQSRFVGAPPGILRLRGLFAYRGAYAVCSWVDERKPRYLRAA